MQNPAQSIEKLFSSNYQNAGVPVIDVFKQKVANLNETENSILDFLEIEFVITKSLMKFVSQTPIDISSFASDITGFLHLFYTERLAGYTNIKTVSTYVKKK